MKSRASNRSEGKTMVSGEVERIKRAYAGYDASPRYNALWSEANPGNACISKEREATQLKLLRASGLFPLPPGTKILDVGCGEGDVLCRFLSLGAEPANLWGIDLMEQHVTEAKACYPEVNFLCANAEQLDFPDRTFDIILIYTIISSILDRGMAANVASEALRVLKAEGLILLYDFRYNNWWNPDNRRVSKKEIQTLFPDCEYDFQTITLLPPLARRLGSLTPILYPLLVKIPFLRTHYLVGICTRPLNFEKERMAPNSD